MRFGVAQLLVSCLLGGCCASHGTRPAASSRSALAAACSAEQRTGPRWREMTLAEYYAEVEYQAWRHGATVIWVDSPPVTTVPRADFQRRVAAASCAR
jgi:hypothetical protein